MRLVDMVASGAEEEATADALNGGSARGSLAAAAIAVGNGLRPHGAEWLNRRSPGTLAAVAPTRRPRCARRTACRWWRCAVRQSAWFTSTIFAIEQAIGRLANDDIAKAIPPRPGSATVDQERSSPAHTSCNRRSSSGCVTSPLHQLRRSRPGVKSSEETRRAQQRAPIGRQSSSAALHHGQQRWRAARRSPSLMLRTSSSRKRDCPAIARKFGDSDRRWPCRGRGAGQARRTRCDSSGFRRISCTRCSFHRRGKRRLSSGRPKPSTNSGALASARRARSNKRRLAGSAHCRLSSIKERCRAHSAERKRRNARWTGSLAGDSRLPKA